MDNLKPCPFCGKDAQMKIRRHWDNRGQYTPQCTDTSCPGRITKFWLDKEQAVEAWNRRVSDE